jgi:indole-3-glycerol phosphate synthase
VPVVRKDFLVDRWQIWESRVAGADAALLLIAALEPDEIAAMAAEAAEAGLALLVEIHAPAEALLAVSMAAPILGVNARDLSSLEVDMETALSTLRALRRDAPEAILVAESGIAGPGDVRRAGSAGADAVLVGEHLARASDPGQALERLVVAARGPQ